MSIEHRKSKAENRGNGVATAEEWRQAARAERLERAEPLRLPSGATVLASRPGPLEWIISGRIPQRLLAVALEEDGAGGASELKREDVLDLARFASQLIAASVLEPAIGDGPGEIPLEEIPLEDRAFIFEWACRAMSGQEVQGSEFGVRSTGTPNAEPKEDSVPHAGIERFRSK